MICKPCMEGGSANKIGLVDVAIEKHEMCNFKGCCCQHKVNVVAVDREKHSSE